ncbi:unnamed protein product [Lepeophtheirus salmonis]|uniref:(salmon louse) hypothetical protein n=1 Tax=Lepeophtheirus salmonis TaxID=72036 RepID=A0A7R8H3F1_LEPSM|nr:unnamed protein product [Lepeophtheirus salmonis]CAF2830477.1 unnamed protein product [Lepeophtheirus salmonis]
MLLLNKAILIILCSLTTRVSLLENNSNLTNSSPPPSQDLHHRRVEIIKTDTWDPKLKERWNAFLEKRGREIAFDSTSSSLNITSVAGKDVYLTCALNKPIRGKYKISLMRLRDLNLLAVDKSLHTKDPRMEILKSSLENRVWTLKIRDAVPEDSGLYECHLNSIPKSKTLLLSMTIIEGRIRILPTNHVLHLNVGSDLNLTCVVESGPVQPKYIHWYHKNILLQYAENSPATIKSNFNQIGVCESLLTLFHSKELDL